jgi:hypothetical protein
MTLSSINETTSTRVKKGRVLLWHQQAAAKRYVRFLSLSFRRLRSDIFSIDNRHNLSKVDYHRSLALEQQQKTQDFLDQLTANLNFCDYWRSKGEHYLGVVS